MSMRIGCCITPHGFGHAARTAAILEAIGRRLVVQGVIGTTVPRWFFNDSLSISFSYSRLTTDIGLIQKNSLVEDLPATRQALDRFYPLSNDCIDKAADIFKDCDCILCDIAPLGIAAARRLGIPSLLIENFTWDWIYSGYQRQLPALGVHIEHLAELYGQADYHLQTDPVCRPVAGAVRIPPVSRIGKKDRRWIRRFLGIDEQAIVVLVTMGGLARDDYNMGSLQQAGKHVFLLAGKGKSLTISGNIYQLPRQCGLYHPDLIAASDLVVGKVGYSTLAEVYAAGVPYAYVCRETFRESAILAEFIEHNNIGLAIGAVDFQSGRWLQRLPELLSIGSGKKPRENGANVAARFITDRLFVQRQLG